MKKKKHLNLHRDGRFRAQLRFFSAACLLAPPSTFVSFCQAYASQRHASQKRDDLPHRQVSDSKLDSWDGGDLCCCCRGLHRLSLPLIGKSLLLEY